MSHTVPRTKEKLKQKPQDHSGSCGRLIPVYPPIVREKSARWPDRIHSSFLYLFRQRAGWTKSAARRKAREEG